MPIRMEEDPQEPRREQPKPSNNQGGGGGGLMQILPFALTFLFKKPKLLVPVLIVGAIWWFFLGGSNILSGGGSIADGGGGGSNIASNEFSFGAALSEEEYSKAEIFEPLQYSSSGVPSRAILTDYAPTPSHQGRQGSCVGWAASYCARTILHARQTGAKPDNAAFSPSFLYNQIALEGCQGAYMQNAMKTMKEGGVLPLQQYPYDDSSCASQPTNTELSRAAKFKTKGYNRLTLSGNYGTDIEGAKQNLSQGAPVVIGMMVGGTFMSDMRGRDTWQPTQRDYSQYGYSGHAMCLVGYDDNKNGGSFLLQNSWGTDWGKGGRAWVSYADFNKFNKEAYGLYPMGSSEQFDANKLAAKVGLVSNATGALIALAKDGERIYRTRTPIRKGDKFKVAVTNTIESYIYVFGQETDGSSYVLFPYTDKHSAYCGIIGTRVFPRDFSMVADDLGSRDRIAVIVSKTELDHQQVNQYINGSQQPTFARKVQEVVSQVSATSVKFTDSEGAIDFDATLDGKNVVAVVVEIDKN